MTDAQQQAAAQNPPATEPTMEEPVQQQDNKKEEQQQQEQQEDQKPANEEESKKPEEQSEEQGEKQPAEQKKEAKEEKSKRFTFFGLGKLGRKVSYEGDRWKLGSTKINSLFSSSSLLLPLPPQRSPKLLLPLLLLPANCPRSNSSSLLRPAL